MPVGPGGAAVSCPGWARPFSSPALPSGLHISHCCTRSAASERLKPPFPHVKIISFYMFRKVVSNLSSCSRSGKGIHLWWFSDSLIFLKEYLELMSSLVLKNPVMYFSVLLQSSRIYLSPKEWEMLGYETRCILGIYLLFESEFI